MKIFKYLILSISIVVLTSCEDDNGTNESMNNLPANFELFVENITVDSALIKWNESENNSESEATYSIYLNDELLNDNINTFEYSLDDLKSSSEYTVKIIAQNEFGNHEKVKQFSTLENKTLYAIKYSENDNETILSYQNEKIVQLSGEEYWVSYEYDINGNIISQKAGREVLYGNSIYHSYDDNVINEINLYDGYADALEIHQIVYITDSSYTRTEYFDDIERNYVGTFNVSITRDQSNRIIEFVSVNVNDNVTTRLNFTYDSNNNLIQIIDQDQNDHDIIYDNKRNFHTYSSGYSNGWESGIPDVASLLFLDGNIVEKLRLVPDLYSHINSNNPCEYRLNGNKYRSFRYEYNQYNYPIKIVTDDHNLTIEYQ